MNLREHLISLGACQPALDWVGSRPAVLAWRECQSASWLLWWAARTSVNEPESVVRFAAALHRQMAAQVGTKEDFGGKIPPGWAEDTDLECEAKEAMLWEKGAQLAAIMETSSLPKFWEDWAVRCAEIWREPSLRAWRAAVKAYGPDYCLNARDQIRQPWREA